MIIAIIYIIGLIITANVMEIYRKRKKVIHRQKIDDDTYDRYHDYKNCICYNTDYWWQYDCRWITPIMWPLPAIFYFFQHFGRIVAYMILLPTKLFSSDCKCRLHRNKLTGEDMDRILREAQELVESK